MELGSLYVNVEIEGAQSGAYGLEQIDQALEHATKTAKYFDEVISHLQKKFDKQIEKNTRWTNNFRQLGTGAINETFGEVAEFGAQLSNFAKMTDISAEALQRWAYAGEIAGISTDTMRQTIVDVQRQMDEFRSTGEGPQWIIDFMDAVNFDINRTNDIMYMMHKFQQLGTMKGISSEDKRNMFRSFGFGDEMTSGFMSGAFKEEWLQEADVLTEEEISDLKYINQELNRRQQKIKQAYMKAKAKTAKYAASFLRGTDKLQTIIDNILEIIQKIIDGFTKNVIEPIVNWFKEKLSSIPIIGNLVNGKEKEDSKLWKLLKFAWNGFKDYEVFDDILPDKPEAPTAQTAEELLAADKNFNSKTGHQNQAPHPVDTFFQKIGNIFSTDAGKVNFFDDFKDALSKTKLSTLLQNQSAKGLASSRETTVYQTNTFNGTDDNPAKIYEATKAGASAANSEGFDIEKTSAARAMLSATGGY